MSTASSRSPIRRRRLVALAVIGAAAFAAGLLAGGRGEPSERTVAAEFGAAWAKGDYARMHALLSNAALRRTSLARLRRSYRASAETLTLTRVVVGRAGRPNHGAVDLPVRLETRVFGTLTGTITLPFGPRGTDATGVDWRSWLTVPGLRRGERLTRQTRMAPRADIEARDGSAIARGPGRLSDLPPQSAAIAGTLGTAPPEREAALEAAGVPPGTPVGLTGLERQFDDRLRGTPGGALLAGRRVLVSTQPKPGRSVRSTIDPAVQVAATNALAGRFGGVAAVRPSDGEVLALAGIAASAPQPPGSTFKIVTLAGALEAGVTKPSARYPVATFTTIEGVKLRNAHDEACGGSLRVAFAESCNSVFAPLGAKLGPERLVRAAEAFGFNADPGLAGAARSTIPPPDQIGDDLAVGSSAIGQGKVLATALQMALVGATIGAHGRRPTPTLLKGAGRAGRQVLPRATASTIAHFMRAVVSDGTGSGAALGGIKVAGKTGTAELRDTVAPDGDPGNAQPSPTPRPEDTTDTDAWFTAFAPLGAPRVAVCVLLVGQGAGGETAAPAARPVLQAALTRRAA